MSVLTSYEADTYLYALADPVIASMERAARYRIPVYYDGLEAPRNTDVTKIYVWFKPNSVRAPFAIGSHVPWLVEATLEIRIYATPKPQDYRIGQSAVEALEAIYTRCRFGSLWVKSGGYTSVSDLGEGRRTFNLSFEYEYEKQATPLRARR